MYLSFYSRLPVSILGRTFTHGDNLSMRIDIVDYVEPTMLIVGSRGLGNLKGYVVVYLYLESFFPRCSERMFCCSILLGSTSHYLIQVRL